MLVKYISHFSRSEIVLKISKNNVLEIFPVHDPLKNTRFEYPYECLKTRRYTVHTSWATLNVPAQSMLSLSIPRVSFGSLTFSELYILLHVPVGMLRNGTLIKMLL